MGWLVSDHLPGLPPAQRVEHRIADHSAFGCCIQASMIMGLLLPDLRELAVPA